MCALPGDLDLVFDGYGYGDSDDWDERSMLRHEEDEGDPFPDPFPDPFSSDRGRDVEGTSLT